MKPITKNSILMLIVIVLAFGPLFLVRGGEFAGADQRASAAISTLAPNYESWFNPLYEPASGEVETFLFALQAALGSGFFFYYIGYAKGKHSLSKKDQA